MKTLGIISFKSTFFIDKSLINLPIKAEVITSGNINQLSAFCNNHDILLFNCADGIAYTMSNLPIKDEIKQILMIDGYELYEPIDRINWAKFDNVLVPSKSIRTLLTKRALKQKFNGYNQSKIKLCNYEYDKISCNENNNIGIFNFSDKSNIPFIISSIQKIKDNSDTPIFSINYIGNIEFTSPYNYLTNSLRINFIKSSHSKITDWIADQHTIIFPNWGIGDLIWADACKKSGINIIALDELSGALNGYNPEAYKTLKEIIKEYI